MIAHIFNALRPISRAAATGGPTFSGTSILRFLYMGVSLASLPHIWEIWGAWLSCLAALFVIAHTVRRHPAKLSQKAIGLLLSATTAACLAPHFALELKALLAVTLTPLEAWPFAFLAIAALEFGVQASLSE